MHTSRILAPDQGALCDMQKWTISTRNSTESITTKLFNEKIKVQEIWQKKSEMQQ